MCFPLPPCARYSRSTYAALQPQRRRVLVSCTKYFTTSRILELNASKFVFVGALRQAPERPDENPGGENWRCSSLTCLGATTPGKWIHRRRHSKEILKTPRPLQRKELTVFRLKQYTKIVSFLSLQTLRFLHISSEQHFGYKASWLR